MIVQKAKAVGGEGAILVVIVNNDEQATLKKGKPFMPGKERVQIIRALKVCLVVACAIKYISGAISMLRVRAHVH